MATPENTFLAGIRKHLPKDIYVLKNNNQFHAGVPDLWISGSKADLWIEAKFIAVPKRDDTLVVPDLSALQVNWLKSRHEEGRSVGVIVGCKDGGVWYPGVSWEKNLTSLDFRKKIVGRSEIADTIVRLVKG